MSIYKTYTIYYTDENITDEGSLFDRSYAHLSPGYTVRFGGQYFTKGSTFKMWGTEDSSLPILTKAILLPNRLLQAQNIGYTRFYIQVNAKEDGVYTAEFNNNTTVHITNFLFER